MLRNLDAKKYSLYQRRLKIVAQDENEVDPFKIDMEKANDYKITLNYKKMRKDRDIDDLDKSMFNFVEDTEQVHKEYEDLEAAAGLLFENLMKGKDFVQIKTQVKDYMSEFIKKGFVECRYG